MRQSLFPNGLRGIIYDCDGVMINSRVANSIFYNRVLAYFGLPKMTKEQEDYSFMATGMQALLYILPEHLHPEIDRVVRDEVNYERDIVPLLTLMDGFRDFVEDVHALGIREAMCTNRTDRGFEDVLSFFHFPRLFDPIMTASKAEPKPSPDGAIQILEAWKADPRDVLFIGDSDHDRLAARGAGCVFCAFNGLHIHGDIEAQNYEELRAKLPWVFAGK